MRYEIWEVDGAEPVSEHDSHDEARAALAALLADGLDNRDLVIRPSSAGSGQIFDGGVDLVMPE
jgi:hypothetical protein